MIYKNKFDTIPEDSRPYKLTHQLISLTGINIHRKSILGLVELTIIPKKSNLRCVKLNVKQCKIYRAVINDTFEAQFDYYDLTAEITPLDSNTNGHALEHFCADHKNAVLEGDPDAGGGELIVRLPQEASHVLVEGRPFRLTIEYSLEKPQGGLHFVVPKDPTGIEKPHMFTTRHENSSRLWFPCIDSFSEVCTWKLEFTVEESYTAVSCGELLEIVQAADGSRRKVFHYFLSVPTAAPNIGLAVGPFDIYVDPKMHEVTHFCLPGLMNLLRWTSRFLHEMFEFYEELLTTRFPYTCYKTVYIHEAYEEMQSFASMCILDTCLLHTSAILDQTYVTRRFTAVALAEQFYSCYISIQHSSDSWLAKGISNFLSLLYIKKFLGMNEYRNIIFTDLQDVLKYEQQYGGIVLDPCMLDKSITFAGPSTTESNSSCNVRPSNQANQVPGADAGFYFSLSNPHTISPEYLKVLSKKAHLVIRMLEMRIGATLFIQVLNKQLSLANIYIAQSQQSGMGLVVPQAPPPTTQDGPSSNTNNPILISTASFTRAVFNVTGKDMTVFMDQWVRQGGHVHFQMSFIFNRKRNTVELEIKQENLHQLGVRKYVGPLTVSLQELDGTFRHLLQIEGTHAKADIVCHSKSRRQKKKKIPLCTGEEVDMDLSAMDADSPVLWIRLDPDISLIRQTDVRQPDFQWQYQLKHERDVPAQIQAVLALEAFPTPQTRVTLTEMIENEQCFIRVRTEACYVLAKVANAMSSTWTGPPAMINIFRKLFGSFSCPGIIKHNDFSNLQHYYLQKSIPASMASLRNTHGICPSEVLKFLIDLFKYNDNSRNQISDNYYRATLVQSLGNTVTPVVSLLQSGSDITAESLSSDTRLIMEEITRCLNLEKMLHCYKYVVTVECLKALRKLQKFGHLPNNVEVFKAYAEYGQFHDVRLAALEAVVDYTRTDGKLDDAEFLLNIVENDPVPTMRHDLCRLIIRCLTEKMTDRRPRAKSPLHSKTIALRIWKKMNYECIGDARLRCDLVDLYYTLFGIRKPLCFLDDSQQNDEAFSRRKSALTTREGVEEFKRESPTIIETEPPKTARILSSKRESMASDNSGDLPEAMDIDGMPTSFEPGMFKNDDLQKPRIKEEKGAKTDVDNGDHHDELVESNKDKEVRVKEEGEEPSTSSHKKHHHHHHNKAKKKKDKKKKHKHKHKHKHEHKKKTREETLSSGSSGSNSPVQQQ
ncbi:transcription initiation factor TFIID subunit 2 [Folsomia candida]|uniref:transcription initiation factor TFIID subunit 2 n=1 Tax=Folsomia candida TaxID=158441 RepID=UPI000B8EF742|nr:transcription initiation factor TFIID subunit 2 [Folsomia candida]